MENAKAAVPGQNFGGGACHEQIKEAKRFFRAKIRKGLLALSAAQRKEKSQKAALNFLQSSIYKNAECLAAFCSLPDEVDAMPVIGRALLDKKNVLLPRVLPNTNQMEFYQLDGENLFAAAGKKKDFCLESALLERTEVNSWGIREPLLTLPMAEKEKFLPRTAILVPGLAFSKDGRRLGRGKGFYDRFLRELLEKNGAFRREGKICGYCFDFQIADDIPIEENDVLMHEVFF